MKNWTTSHIPNLSGKTMIVTEGDSSLGYECAKAFALNGASTILACKNPSIGEKIKAEFLVKKPEAVVEVMPLDLRDPKSIQQFGKAFNEKFEQLDVLMNIGDTHTIPGAESAKHFGKHFNSDHAGHFLLTTLLVSKLANTPKSRVVNMSLGEHKLKDKDFQKMMRPNGHNNNEKHKIGSFKWTNLMFTFELQKLFDTRKVNCLALAAYAGPENKNFARRMQGGFSWKMFKAFYGMVPGPNAADSAFPGIKAALAANAKGGAYFGPNGEVEESGYASYSAVMHFVA